MPADDVLPDKVLDFFVGDVYECFRFEPLGEVVRHDQGVLALSGT